jgi:hypothetical protein
VIDWLKSLLNTMKSPADYISGAFFIRHCGWCSTLAEANVPKKINQFRTNVIPKPAL